MTAALLLLLELIAASGRVELLTESASARVSPPKSIAPGPPPILSFRYFEGQAKHRFGDIDLVVDDANH